MLEKFDLGFVLESTALRAVEMGWMTSGSRTGAALMGGTLGVISNLGFQTLHQRYRGYLDPKGKVFINLASYGITVIAMSMVSAAKFNLRNNLYCMACSLVAIAALYFRYVQVETKIREEGAEAFRDHFNKDYQTIKDDQDKLNLYRQLRSQVTRLIPSELLERTPVAFKKFYFISTLNEISFDDETSDKHSASTYFERVKSPIIDIRNQMENRGRILAFVLMRCVAKGDSEETIIQCLKELGINLLEADEGTVALRSL